MEDDNDNNEEEDSTELLSEALLAVASAEEYAAKIIRLQQACLTPLKEDLADWLNKIMNMSTITRENFMNKLDNGAIICRLAKIISFWCEQQSDIKPNNQLPQTQQASNTVTNINNNDKKTLMSNQFRNNLIRMEQTKIWEDAKCKTFYARDNVCNFIRWCREFGVNQSVLFESDDLVLHANTRQVVLCLLDVARIACVKFGFTEAPGLVKFEQEIDRELAAEKAAYLERSNQAQDYASRQKQMTLSSFNCDKSANRSDNLLMKLNQSSFNSKNDDATCDENHYSATNKKLSSLTRNSRVTSLADATDDLIMRYCLHKEEEAARKKAAQLEMEARSLECKQLEAASEETAADKQSQLDSCEIVARLATVTQEESLNADDGPQASDQLPLVRSDDLEPTGGCEEDECEEAELRAGSEEGAKEREFADSLDSGEGRTESGSKSNSCTPLTSCASTAKIGVGKAASKASAIPLPIKRSSSNSSLISNQSSSLGSSEDLVATASSSSRSSLLDIQDSSRKQRHIASDLDGKVMRIAKSYYGKAVNKGVTRLSEGKYRIADRIVFVRLLKGHRVMVRIGGGWDTLENFLFRHKSDPSQVIDVNNLLPLETKLSLDKSPQLTSSSHTVAGGGSLMGANGNRLSKLPYYRRSSSASSTNLSASINSECCNHSPTSSSATSSTNQHVPVISPLKSARTASHDILATPIRNRRYQHQAGYQQQSPFLLIHQNHNNSRLTNSVSKTPTKSQLRSPMAGVRQHFYSSNRPLGNSRTPAASTINLYPATLTTRLTASSIKNSPTANSNGKLNTSHNMLDRITLHPPNQLANQRSAKQEAFRRLGRSNDSLQASAYHNNHYNKSSTQAQNRRKLDTRRESNLQAQNQD